MKIFPNIPFADAKEERRQGEQAFTMVEIAIAIGVIGFALVAVIGILPAGMNVQKDNREDTTISEDAPLFLSAIKNGINLSTATTPALDFLTNYVENITIYSNNNGTITVLSTNFNFTGGAQIIGLLSTPQPPVVTSSNFLLTRAIVRSLGGAAVQQNGANLATSFRYQMDVEVVPFVNIATDTTNFDNYTYGTPDYITRSNRWLEVNPAANPNPAPEVVNLPLGMGTLAYNLYDVRLHFSWPVLPNGNVGPGRQNYRAMVSSALLPGAMLPSGAQLWFFQPQFYTNQSTL